MKNNIDNTNERLYTGEEVYNYFIELGSENSNSPYDNPISDRREDILNNNYLLKDINIKLILNHDVDMADYVKTDSWEYKKNREVNSIGLIGDSSFAKDVVIDGFHRLTQKKINGDNSMQFFVPIGSRYEFL